MKMNRRNATIFAVGFLTVAGLTALAAEGEGSATGGGPTVVDVMEQISFVAPEKAKVEIVEGKDGGSSKALKFSFEDDSKGVFVRGRAVSNAAWDKAAGLSFWVRGDGSDHLGGIQFVWNGDYAARYGYAFPISGTAWRKVVVPWRDLIPELSAPLKPIDARTGNAPSKLGAITFGKWWHWDDYAAHSYTIDDIRLEPSIPGIALDAKVRPSAALPLNAPPLNAPPLARVLAKLKARRPITVVTMGDSLTDLKHWANKETNWPTLLQNRLKEQYGSEVTLLNPALGGTELRHNLVLLPRWTSKQSRPDLVLVFFGFNDYAAGMRGAAFRETQKDAIQRIRRATGGVADILIVTTCPPLENGWRLAELAVACARAAGEEDAGLCDIYSAFQSAAGEEDAGLCDIYSAFQSVTEAERARLYVHDKVHLAPPSHELVAQTVLQAIENGG